MVFTEKNFDKISILYMDLVKEFLVVNRIKEVVCNDWEEHFFDKIVLTNAETKSIKVYNHGFVDTTWNNLYLDFTLDYAQCLAKMEHDLFMQERNGKHKNYTFIFF